MSNHTGAVSPKLLIASTEAGKPLGKAIIAEAARLIGEINCGPIPLEFFHFADGEGETVYEKSVRRQHVVVVDQRNLTLPNGKGATPEEQFEQLKDTIRSAKWASAGEITVVVPLLYKSRQHKQNDRKDIGVDRVGQELLLAGAHNVFTANLHHSGSVSSFDGICDNLSSFRPLSRAVIQHITGDPEGQLDPKEWIISSADVNAGMAVLWANKLGLDLNICWKKRDYTKPNSIAEIRVLGDVKDKKVIIFDDMIDTVGTLKEVIQALVGDPKEGKEGAGAISVIACCTHPIFSNPALERIKYCHDNLKLKKVFGTDSVWHEEKFFKKNSWFKQISLAPLLAQVIVNLHLGQEVSDAYAV